MSRESCMSLLFAAFTSSEKQEIVSKDCRK